MTPELWQRVQDVVDAALDMPVTDRAAYLARACGEDGELLRRATELVHAHEQAGSFSERCDRGPGTQRRRSRRQHIRGPAGIALCG